LQTRILFLSVLFLFGNLTYSQEKSYFDSTSSRQSITFKIVAGSVIPHERVLNPLKKGTVKALEISYSIKKLDNSAWRSYYNYPEIGFSYMFMDFGYKEVLGYSHSIYPYLKIPLTGKDKPFDLSIRMALGFSYITKLYDSISNPKNVAISTPINLFASFGLELTYKISSKISANIAFSGSHFSNGLIKKPNYGINILSGSLGINYNINQHSNLKSRLSELEIDKSRWLAILTGAIKETKDPGGPKYGVGFLSLEYSKSFCKQLRYGTSLDYMYDGSTFVHFKDDSVSYKSQLKASKIGLTCMGEMTLNRLSIFANMGVYLYNHDRQIDPIYQRIGIRYRLSKSFYTQLAVKTHLNVADYIEFGVGFKL
jgi:hypothetical protein